MNFVLRIFLKKDMSAYAIMEFLIFEAFIRVKVFEGDQGAKSYFNYDNIYT